MCVCNLRFSSPPFFFLSFILSLIYSLTRLRERRAATCCGICFLSSSLALVCGYLVRESFHYLLLSLAHSNVRNLSLIDHFIPSVLLLGLGFFFYNIVFVYILILLPTFLVSATGLYVFFLFSFLSFSECECVWRYLALRQDFHHSHRSAGLGRITHCRNNVLRVLWRLVVVVDLLSVCLFTVKYPRARAWLLCGLFTSLLAPINGLFCLAVFVSIVVVCLCECSVCVSENWWF